MLGSLLVWLLPTIQVTPDGWVDAKEPQIAIDRDERIYVAYGMQDSIFVSISSDHGKTYGTPIKVAQAGKLSLGMRRGPRIAAREGILTITAVYGEQGKGKDGDIVAFRSDDRGKTWTGPVRVNDVVSSGREGLHAMAIAPDGTLACTWLDMRTVGTKLFLSVSKDGGTTWSPNVLAYQSPSGAVCECCHPTAAFGKDGKLTLMFRNSLEGNRDMYTISSSDLHSFSTASKLGEGSWQLKSCPMDGGMLAFDENGVPQAIWRRGTTVYRCTPGAAEQSLFDGSQPWIAAAGSSMYLVWQDGPVIHSRIDDGLNENLSASGKDPVVAASPSGKTVIAAWTERGIRSATLR